MNNSTAGVTFQAFSNSNLRITPVETDKMDILELQSTSGTARMSVVTSNNQGIQLGITDNAQAFLWNSNNTDIQFGTNNTEVMRIDNTGNLRIGTTTNDSANVSGKLAIVSNNSKTTDLEFRTDDNTENNQDYPTAKIEAGFTGTDWRSAYLKFKTHATDGVGFTDDMIIKGGIINAPYHLHVGTTSSGFQGSVPTGDPKYNVTGKIPFYCTKTTNIHGTYTSWMNLHNYYTSTGLSYYESWNTRTDGYYYGNINVVGSFAGSVQVSGNIHMYSDRRIKKEIVDANDNNCLNIIRQIKNRKYKYIDPFSEKESNNEVYGFIAQEVKELIPEAVGRSTEFIPNIMMEGDIVSHPNNNNQYYITTSNEFTIENTLEGEVYIKSFEINYDNDIIHTLKFISQENSKRILVECNESLPDRLFLYGEIVYDFHTLDKNKIYTISVGAIQEIDRRQEADKVKITNLENELSTIKQQYNDLLSRIVALENK